MSLVTRGQLTFLFFKLILVMKFICYTYDIHTSYSKIINVIGNFIGKLVDYVIYRWARKVLRVYLLILEAKITYEGHICVGCSPIGERE